MIDVLVVGAGFAGLYLLHKLRENGFSALALEAGQDVGGTWYWNRYPGARCDVESCEYQLAFPPFLQTEWTWSERFATQPEIERYLRFVTDRLDLRRDIYCGQRVVSARYQNGRWIVQTVKQVTVTARFCVMATGCLSVAQLPALPGLADFKGPVYHTGQWPTTAPDFSGLSVGLIGTGSSGVQVMPKIADVARHLTVFQRTANFVFPVSSHSLGEEELQRARDRFAANRERARGHPSGSLLPVPTRCAHDMTEEEREAAMEAMWQLGSGFAFLFSFADILTDEAANRHAAEFFQRKIRQMIHDPELAERVTPTGYPIGSKRLCLGIDYYETLMRPNVTLVDLTKEPIRKLTRDGIVVGSREHALEAIVFATGFDAMTGALSKIAVSSGNSTLAEKWTGGAPTYLGLAVAGFPNLFLVTGPGSPSVLSNVVVSIEQHVDWIVDCLKFLRTGGFDSIEADPDAEAQWVDHVNQVAHATLLPRANSWYMGANIPGKPRMFLPYVAGVGAYRDKCNEVAIAGYAGFTLGGRVRGAAAASS